jgi:cytochrome c biogenesis protein CcdA
VNQTDTGAGLILYSFTLGLAAAVNPCGFPMLPAYLALFAGTRAGPKGARIAGALLCGASMSAGFVITFGTLGLVLQGGIRLATGALPWLMIAAGLAMTVAGVFTVAGRGPRLRLPTPRIGKSRSMLAMVLYGIAYAAGSLSCSLPLFLAALGGSLAGSGVAGALTSYFAYALGMGLFVTSAAVIAVTAGSAALRHVRSAARWLPAVSGIILILAGSYLVYYWAGEILAPALSSPLTAAVGAVQSGLAAFLDAKPLLTALALAAIVLGSITAVVRHTLTTPHSGSAHETDPADRPAQKGTTGP